jgi:hypothetical protein
MTEPLTDRQLAAMQARESAATPPPWNAVDATDGFVALVRTDGADARTLARVAVAADGEFMARARADMPALLAEVTRLRTELDLAREARLEWSRIGDHPELAHWADSLVSADLTPHPAHACCSTTTGYEVAMQVATTDQLTDTATAELLAELKAAFTATVCRVLGRTDVAAPSCSCGARPVRQVGSAGE